ncbi:hypothetical protein EIP86_010954 [Pleurotus ostreatoroseus]|nr:hypothetical protein EIP86_010954 [Pleurotus ostreatoroseus]
MSMSTTSLPSYAPPGLGSSYTRIPSYTAEPRAFEQRLALNRGHPRPSGEFTKHSRSGGVSLRFPGQDRNATLPVYGNAGVVEGVVEVAKPEGVHSVEVKVKGTLLLKEIAEGGAVNYELCLSRLSLWNKDRDAGSCPSSLPFVLTLPATFNDGKHDYPLPPTHEVHLSGLPGFRATVEYSVTATVDRGSLVKKAAATLMPKQNNNAVSTPFVYYPRTRPAAPLPPPMIASNKAPGVVESADWRCFEAAIPARASGVSDIISKLYIPASRVFCMSERIPFHLTLSSTAYSLAAFMPYGPTPSLLSPIDVRNTVVFGTKTDIWRISSIGNGRFRRAIDGPDFLSFAGEITISEDVRIPGFKAGGLSIKDSIVLTMVPPDISKSPFDEFRCVVPIRLTTDPWTHDGSGDFAPSEYSVPSSEEEARGPHPDLADFRQES